MTRLLVLLIACAVAGGCATTGADGNSMFAPTEISDLYSQVSLRVTLAFTPGERRDHFENPERECAGPGEFEQRVERIGARLAEAAYHQYPGLRERIPRFVFTVSDKKEPGVASTAGGLIVVLQPVGDISLSDEALAFVIAREIGHVASRHHEQNTAISIAFSVASAVLMPALNVAKLLAVVTSSSSGAIAANTLSSAASFAGSRAVIASYGGRQRKTADTLAARLLPQAGYSVAGVPDGFVKECPADSPTTWLRELNESVALLAPGDDLQARPAPAQADASPAQSVAVAEGTAAVVAECTEATPAMLHPITATLGSSDRSPGEVKTPVVVAAHPNTGEPGNLVRALLPQ